MCVRLFLQKCSFTVSLMVFVSSAAFADQVTEEKELLAGVVDTLSVATSYAVKAQLMISANGRESFEYLIADLREVQGGVQRHLHQPAMQQRSIEPLHLNYKLAVNDDIQPILLSLVSSLDKAASLAIEAKFVHRKSTQTKVRFSFEGLLTDIEEIKRMVEKSEKMPSRSYRDLSEIPVIEGVDGVE